MTLENYWALFMEVEGWLAQFRVVSAVTTQLSNLLPSKSALIGMLLAKAGVMRLRYDVWPKVYEDLIKKVKVGISVNATFNRFQDFVLFKEKGESDGQYRTPTQIEYLVLPRFSFVFLLPKDDPFLGWTMKERLLSQELFKVVLGSNECPASLTRVEVFDVNVVKKASIRTRFAVPNTKVESVNVGDLHKVLFTEFLVSPPNAQYQVFERLILPREEVEVSLKSDSLVLNTPKGDVVMV